MLDPTFNKVKGYVNTTKHKHLIRITNNWKNLEFEEYQFKRPVLDQNGKLSFQEELLPRQDAITFVAECHDALCFDPEIFPPLRQCSCVKGRLTVGDAITIKSTLRL